MSATAERIVPLDGVSAEDAAKVRTTTHRNSDVDTIDSCSESRPIVPSNSSMVEELASKFEEILLLQPENQSGSTEIHEGASHSTNIDGTSENNTAQGLLPNFRVGCGEGDISVSLPLVSSLANGTCASSPSISVSESLLSNTTGTDVDRLESAATNGGGHSSPGPSSLSRQNSDEMPLSLVSWYSEPGDSSFYQKPNCCKGGKTSPAKTPSSSALIKPSTDTDKSEEKENKTPTDCHTPNNNTTTLVKGATLTKQRVKMHVEGLETKSKTDSGTLCNENGFGARWARCSTSVTTVVSNQNESVDCARCSRRSKSGSTTPATPSRTLRRQINSTKSGNSDLKKPIKSILKCESRGSSGSDKISSMDSLGSNSGRNRMVAMTRSDGGPRAKFDFRNSDQSLSFPEDKMVARLKSVEKYATLRIRKSRVSPLDMSSGGGSEVRKNLGKPHSSQTTIGGPGAPIELMTKSMSFLEKANPNPRILPHSAGADTSMPLQRQGSLRVRKPSPGWEPSATRSSMLRLLKMQETKAKSGGGHLQSNQAGSTHSGSGESITNHNSLVYTATPTRSTVKEPKNFGAKIFSKLSSALGQTASSAQKRLRQDKWVQTEERRSVTPEVRLSSQHSRNATTTAEFCSQTPEPEFDSSIPTLTQSALSESWPKADTRVIDSDYISQLHHQAKKLEKKYLRSKAVYSQVVDEKASLSRTIEDLQQQLSTIQLENKQIVHFLEDEKATLSETLSEAEATVNSLNQALETKNEDFKVRLSGLVRQGEQLKQEALTSHAILKRMEKEFSVKLTRKSMQLTDGTSSIVEMKKSIIKMIETLVLTYKVSPALLDSLSGASSNGTVALGLDENSMSGSLLLPLIETLANAFGMPYPSEPLISKGDTNNTTAPAGDTGSNAGSLVQDKPNSSSSAGDDSTNTLYSLKQAIHERDEAERLERVCSMNPVHDGEEYRVLMLEIADLQKVFGKLVSVIRIIVLHCDSRVSKVASNILEVLKSTDVDNFKVQGSPEVKSAEIVESKTSHT